MRKHLKGFVLAHLIRSCAFLSPWRRKRLSKNQTRGILPMADGRLLAKEVHFSGFTYIKG